MRYLNKIILINSANTPYAEIKLDGNVHFIGTQGVGKSTLLRAILFFYNVDKSHLGIRTQDKQKNFDDFYLPFPNSYIIYEVTRENGPFFVMMFRSSGRSAFHIVDCSYKREFFIDESNNVYDMWGKISDAIGPKVFKSRVIRGCEELRDILYGNFPAVNRELRRFCIMESSKYQNVPRTIQNIFLNQGLESGFIKKTIIDSMNFNDDGIDLAFFRNKLEKFNLQYNDIWKWYKQEKNGRIKVRDDADRVLERYSDFEASRRNIERLCGNIVYAENRDKERLPQLGTELDDNTRQLERQRRLLKEENDKYTSERDKLSREEGRLKDLLDTTKKKRQHYDDININDIVSRQAKEPELSIQLNTCQQQETKLTEHNRDIATKYQQLKQTADDELAKFKMQMDKRANEADSQYNAEFNRRKNEESEKLEETRGNYQQQLDDLQEEINVKSAEISKLEARRQSVSVANPYQKEIEQLQADINQLKEKESQLKTDSINKKSQMEVIRKDVELVVKDLTNECDKDLTAFDAQMDKEKQEVAHCDELLSRQQGSLIDWLQQNVKDWENNIGLVLDEENVLYNTQLNPRKEGDASTVYGVRLDTHNIERNLLTPTKLAEDKAAALAAIERIKRQKVERRTRLDDDIQAASQKPNDELSQLRKEQMNLHAQLMTLPQQMKKANLDLEDYEEKLNTWRKNQLAELDLELDKARKERERLEAKKGTLQKKREQDINAIRHDTARLLKDAQTSLTEQKKELSDRLANKQKETSQQKAQLDAMMDAELKGLGVDVGQLAAIRQRANAIKEELRFIESHREDVILWEHDKEEFFNREDSFRDEMKQVKNKLELLSDKFDKRSRKYEEDIRRSEKNENELRAEIKRLKDGLTRLANFKLSCSCPEQLLSAQPEETVTALSELYDNLREEVAKSQENFGRFKEAVNLFKGNFLKENAFEFQTELNTDDDYILFASKLNEFIVNDVIEKYRTKVSGQYASIINRIAQEMRQLNEHSADIQSTINEINRRFRENNFVGAIKAIEIKSQPSTDRVVVQLENIMNFADEHSNEIGDGFNLFTVQKDNSKINTEAVKKLSVLIDLLNADRKRDRLTLADSFKLVFKVRENDNDTDWVEKLSNVGSDGTDVLVKAMVNIMLISVFKDKISRRFGDFKLHCMMDEIGKLHPNNVEGILNFANTRNIFLINSSPTAYNASAYRYTYALSKDDKNNTIVKKLLTVK
ncbi:MAG: ATP-binding protein [Prevotella sp.]|jgi:hypothetical protein